MPVFVAWLLLLLQLFAPASAAALLDRFGPTRLAGPDTTTIEWDWLANGQLDCKTYTPLSDKPFCYVYDEHQRITTFEHRFIATLETYDHDAVGNLTSMWRDGQGPAWTYAATPRFSEMPSRSRTVGANLWVDTQVWDGQGRLSTLTTTKGGAPQQSRAFLYDGAGRLQRQTDQFGPGAGGTTTTQYRYDANDAAAIENRTTGFVTTTTYRFLDWESTGGAAIETLLPMLRRQGGLDRWVL